METKELVLFLKEIRRFVLFSKIVRCKNRLEDSSFSQGSSVQIQTDPSVPCRNGETGHHNYLSVQLLENTQSFDMLYNYN